MLAYLAELLGFARSGVCRCGHPAAAHEHYRPGTDCGLCNSPSRVTYLRKYLGTEPCQKFRRTWRYTR